MSDSFFSSFGIRVLRGRLFLSTDTTSTGAAPVAVVSRAFANEFWPGSDPIEQKVVMPDDRHLTVVGVVADTRSERFGRLDGPRLYTLRGPSALGGSLYVRFAGSAKPLENAIRKEVKSLDPVQTIAPQTIWESLEDQAESITTMAQIILAVASIALLMAVTYLLPMTRPMQPRSDLVSPVALARMRDRSVVAPVPSQSRINFHPILRTDFRHNHNPS